MTTPTLPSNVDYGYVTGQFLLAVGDSSDADATPDGVAPEGLTITFTPEPGWLLNVSATANPITILPSEIVCTVDSEGYLVDPAGNRGVYLIATDDPDLNPIDWNYTVTFRFPDRPKRSFNIAVPTDSETDLTTVTPVAGSIGNAVVRGVPGPSNTLTIGEVITGAPGTAAEVEIVGESPDQVLNFTIPAGDKGDTGNAATVTIDSTTTGDVGSAASVTNEGDEHDAVLTFTVPQGRDVQLGTVTTGLPGSDVVIEDVGTVNQAVLDITIPRGDKGDTGDAATIAVESTATSAPGTFASVENVGDTHDAILRFTVPRGDKGDPGSSNTLSIGTVITGAPGSAATADITGVSPDQTLNLTIPEGNKGDVGTRGSTWRSGAGGPSFTAGDLSGDKYLNVATGDVYACDGVAWSLVGNIKGAPGTGSGTVNSVNGQIPDGTGSVTLDWTDVSGTIPTSKIPAAALTVPSVVADEVAMLALDAQQGDVAIRSDNQTSYMLAAGGNPTILTDWLPISMPGGVTSVNGQQGVVTLNASDVGAQPAGSYATAAQGALADSAVQPTRTVNGKPLSADITLSSSDIGAQPAGSYASAAQGALADSAVQPAALTALLPKDNPRATGTMAVGANPYVYAGTEVGLTVKSPGYYGTLALVANNPLMKFVGDYADGDGAEMYQNSQGKFLFNVNASTSGFGIDANGDFSMEHNASVAGTLTVGGQGVATASQGTKADTALQPNTGIVVVYGGTDPNTPRPAGVPAGGVKWVMTVAPVNALEGDDGYGW